MSTLLRRYWPALTLICVGVLFIAIGVWREEVEVVFRKAVNICMECIGLG